MPAHNTKKHFTKFKITCKEKITCKGNIHGSEVIHEVASTHGWNRGAISVKYDACSCSNLSSSQGCAISLMPTQNSTFYDLLLQIDPLHHAAPLHALATSASRVASFVHPMNLHEGHVTLKHTGNSNMETRITRFPHRPTYTSHAVQRHTIAFTRLGTEETRVYRIISFHRDIQHR